MITRKASLLDMAKLIEIVPELELLHWLQSSRDSIFHQTLVTIHNKKVIAGSFSLFNPETNTVMVLGIFNTTTDDAVPQYVLNKIPSYFKQDGLVATKLIANGPKEKLKFFEDAGFVPVSFVVTKELTVKDGDK